MIRLLLVLAVAATVPLKGTSRQFAGRPLDVASLRAIDEDFGTRRTDSTTKEHPYGAPFRYRYVLKDGEVIAHSGIYDGWFLEWHVKPMTVAQAIALVRAYEKASGNTLEIDFDHPEREAHALTVRSKGDGCQAAFTLKLDAAGRVIEIDDAGAC
jgi:hypothetical protein